MWQNGASQVEIASTLHRSLQSIRHKIQRLNAGQFGHARAWSKMDIRRLQRLYPAAPWDALEVAFPGRTRYSIRMKAQRLGFERVPLADAEQERHLVLALSDTELAYLAGLIDGEGSFVIAKGYPVLSLGSTDKPVIDWLCQKLGGSFTAYPNGGGLGTKPFYRWRLSKSRAVALLALRARPYWIIKRTQAEAAIACID